MTVVVKIGGARAVDPAGALTDVARRVGAGEDVVVVHGGSTAVDETLERLGIAPEYVETPGGVVGRFTDEPTMEVFEMVFGRLNTELVVGLQNTGVNAVGLNGTDGRLLTGPRKSAVRVLEDGKKKIRRGDHSGTIESVSVDLLEGLLSDGFTPVCGPPMLASDGEDGQNRWTAVNTDADRAAAAIAGALNASLVLLTDVPGILEDPDDPASLIERVGTPEELDGLQDVATGFMRRKVMAASEALAGGAVEVVVADANADDPVTAALEGNGTHLLPAAVEAAEGEST